MQMTNPVPSDVRTFLLSRPDHHVIAGGATAGFTDPAAAVAALRSGTICAVVGALPFDLRETSALMAPRTLRRLDGPWKQPLEDETPAATITTEIPRPAEHRRRVERVIASLADPASPLEKVVLARALQVRTESALSPWHLAARLGAGDGPGSVFVADLSAAGPRFTGHHLVGASPEVLIRKQGSTVSCHPLAGSAPRSSDPGVDAARARHLASSTKDLHEHRIVVDGLRAALAPLCSSLDVDDQPSVVGTPTMWHLGTPIRGEVSDTAVTALELALAVHPTAAVCGSPTPAARDLIVATEGSRGFYTGAVGWSDAQGDGQWMVSIRCTQLAADNRTATAWAGGGIVAQSRPDDELRETTAKFRTILAAFGIDHDAADQRNRARAQSA
ncbi:isochorismate synthase [Gordonia sp. PKS22-38]|uniref:isochorismate synthase n=1 Tax=Gordonia prachuapensis TaxID=3115651 RepID=A0ABU7MTF8_9ACTN|nr:isochorismate synthase [Gordonia sp. PKS22-38]